MRVLTFAILLRRMSALPKVLMLISRLGGTVTYVAAAEGRANIVLHTPDAVAHRFAPQMRRIIDVLELTELRVTASPRADEAEDGATVRRLRA